MASQGRERAKGDRHSQFLGGAGFQPWGGLLGAVTMVAIAAPASATLVNDWSFDPGSGNLTVTVAGNGDANFFLLAQPARIVLNLPNTRVGNVPLSRQFGGAVRAIRVGQMEGNNTRIVLELAPNAVLDPRHAELSSQGVPGGRRWVLRPLVVNREQLAIADVPNPPPVNPITPVPPEAAAIPALPATTLNPNPAPPALPGASALQPGDTLPPLPTSTLGSAPSAPAAPVTVPPLGTTPSVPAQPAIPTQPAIPAQPAALGPATPPPPPRPTLPLAFGSPLPGTVVGPALPPPSLGLPAGTRMRLQYPGTETLTLNDPAARYEVLIVAEDVLHPSLGTLLIPRGTQVLGRFEGGEGRTQRFVSQVIVLGGNRQPLNAASGTLLGTPQGGLPVVTGATIGAVAVTVLSGFTGVGLLGGALIGGTTGFLASPQSVLIQPGQIIEVEVITPTEPLPQGR